MVILHIAIINEDPFNGISVAVPKHVIAQQSLAQVGFVNIRNVRFEGIENQFEYTDNFKVASLTEPFSTPDIVVFHDMYSVDCLRIAEELNRRKIPYVILPHGALTSEAQSKKRLKKLVANLLLFNRFIHKAAALQCLSAREVAKTKFRKHKFVATNGIDIDERIKQSFNSDAIDILYIGRLDAQIKGLDLLIQAAAMCKGKTDKKFKITMYGPDYQGRYAAVQAMIAEHGVSDVVELNPPILGQEKQERLLAADIFIQTSRTEGMPMGILEALSYGLPCLVTEGTTLGEFIESNNAGWKCDTCAEDIADKIIQACRETDRYAEKSRCARRAIEQNFAWSVVARTAVDEYSRILDGKKAR